MKLLCVVFLDGNYLEIETAMSERDYSRKYVINDRFTFAFPKAEIIRGYHHLFLVTNH